MPIEITSGGIHPEFFMHRPPVWPMAVEFAYLVIMVTLCLIIYFRTKDFYELAGSKSIYFFRRTFLYFALAYVFRIIPSFEILFRTDIDAYLPMWFHPFGLLMTAFFSTMAILSLAATVFSRQIKIRNELFSSMLMVLSFILSILVFAENSAHMLFAFQGAVFLVTLAGAVLIAARHHKKLTFNTINYLLLLLAWVLNIIGFSRIVRISYASRIVLYLLSIAIFVLIFIRVIKRLPVNAKKKRAA